MKAKETVSEVVKRGVAPLLKRAGFRKEGFRFHRHVNDVLQVVDIQLSQANFADKGEFFISVALGFDALWLGESGSIPEKPKEYECHLRKRIEDIVPRTPSSWHVSSATDVDELSIQLSDRVASLVSELDCMNDTDSVLQGDWLQVGTERILKGRLHYLKGNTDSALNELQAAAEFFADRKGMSLRELVLRYGMHKLEPHLGT